MSEGAENIAVIGISGRFPLAGNVGEFWDNLRSGRECVTFFSAEELLEAGIRPQDLAAPNYVRANAVVKDIDLFDAGFFGFSPRDAEILDHSSEYFWSARGKRSRMEVTIPKHSPDRLASWRARR